MQALAHHSTACSRVAARNANTRGAALRMRAACPLRRSSQAATQQPQFQVPSAQLAARSRRCLSCRAADDRPGSASKGGADLANKFNPIYLAITGAFAALLVFRNPYIYAVLTIATILPQNSNVTSLNNLVLLFYESGLFMNFAEAVYCVRLVTWLSMGFMVFSFSIFQ